MENEFMEIDGFTGDRDFMELDDSSFDSEDMVYDYDVHYNDDLHSVHENRTLTKKQLIQQPKKSVCRVNKSPKKWRQRVITYRLKSSFIASY
jgi:hypothetical protein